MSGANVRFQRSRPLSALATMRRDGLDCPCDNGPDNKRASGAVNALAPATGNEVLMQAERSPERKYALTKIKAGDYLLPSNDGETIWRIGKYEDGPTWGLDALPRDREFWGAWRWRGACGSTVIDPDDWDQWGMEVANCETRADAIRCALEMRRDT